MVKKKKSTLESRDSDDGMMKHVDTPVDHDESFKKHDLQGPLLWELYRTEEDNNFVETSKLFALLNCCTNCQLLTSSDQAGPVEDYLNGCLTKMSEMPLEGAAFTMMEAVSHINEFKSKAPNSGTELIKIKFFLQRTINSSQGGSEHEMRTMIEALLGMKSHVSSEKFHYLIISDLVSFIDKLIKRTNEN